MGKTITNELIISKLEAKGYLKYHDMDENKAWDLLEKHFECEVSDEYRNKSYDFYCYTETTADGYEIWIATNDTDSPCISEDVYYYDSDLAQALYDAMFDYGNLIYVDDLNAYYVQDAIEQAWESFITDMIDEVENELIEQGYKQEEELI